MPFTTYFNKETFYNENNELINELATKCHNNSNIDPQLYIKHNVNRGLRDLNGKGVLTGLTEISDVVSYKLDENGERIPIDGKLYYRGIDIEDMIDDYVKNDRFGFEEVIYLLIFGKLPNEKQLEEFNNLLADYRSLPGGFIRDMILKAPSMNIMNTMARSVLSLYAYDKSPDSLELSNVLRQCLQLIALFPLISVYGYHAFSHYYDANSLYIHMPERNLSTAENILLMLRPDKKYTKLEAQILDIALILHAEHGGGNNSSFTTHVVTSSGTDTYSSTAASLGSLKGPKHGGANIKVVEMFDDLKANVKNWEDEEELSAYLTSLLNKEGFDKSGLIYGMGHAVYSISDPRARVFKKFVKMLSVEKGLEKEFELYDRVERLASNLIAQKRKIYKGVSANVDFYSGFVYRMLGIPCEMFTPIFADARIAGWSAHRLEEIINAGKIIRPAYMPVGESQDYVTLADRK